MDDTPTIVLLVEQSLSDADVETVLREFDGRRRWHVVVPKALPPVPAISAMPGGPLGESVVLGLPGVLPPVPPDHTEEEAAADLTASLDRLRSHGCVADGEVVEPDPVEPLRDVCRRVRASEVVCLTRHHRVAELLHRDWASQVAEALQVPVARLYCHSS